MRSLRGDQKVIALHWSDCATNNEPAYPVGPCTCGGLDPAAYDRYRVVMGVVPTPGRLAAFLGDSIIPSFVESEKTPAAVATGFGATDLPATHHRITGGREADGMDLNDA